MAEAKLEQAEKELAQCYADTTAMCDDLKRKVIGLRDMIKQRRVDMPHAYHVIDTMLSDQSKHRKKMQKLRKQLGQKHKQVVDLCVEAKSKAMQLANDIRKGIEKHIQLRDASAKAVREATLLVQRQKQKGNAKVVQALDRIRMHADNSAAQVTDTARHFQTLATKVQDIYQSVGVHEKESQALAEGIAKAKAMEQKHDVAMHTLQDQLRRLQRGDEAAANPRSSTVLKQCEEALYNLSLHLSDVVRELLSELKVMEQKGVLLSASGVPCDTSSLERVGYGVAGALLRGYDEHMHPDKPTCILDTSSQAYRALAVLDPSLVKGRLWGMGKHAGQSVSVDYVRDEDYQRYEKVHKAKTEHANGVTITGQRCHTPCAASADDPLHRTCMSNGTSSACVVHHNDRPVLVDRVLPIHF